MADGKYLEWLQLIHGANKIDKILWNAHDELEQISNILSSNICLIQY